VTIRYDGRQFARASWEETMNLWPRLVAALALSWLSLQPAAAADRLIPLEVALGDVSLNKVSFLMAADTGIYARNGLDVRQFITPGAAEVARNSGVIVPAQYVKSDIGNAPIAVGGVSPMMYRVANDARGIHRVALLTTEGYIRDTIITTSAIAKVEDLKGKRLGYSVPGAVTHMAALHFVKHMGWDVNRDVSLIGNGNALNPLEEGRTDAFFGSAMTVAMAPEMNLKLLIDLTPFKFPVGGSSIMAERRWLMTNRDTAARFVKASMEAIALMRKDRAAFNAALVKWFNIKDAVTQGRMYVEIEEIPLKPYPTVDGIKATLAAYDSPEMRKYKAEDFYDSSFMTELDRSGFIDRLYR
jgi:ABC-type nitrate/sulfonate/bicarbonate transport system substrate-binding protein